MINTKKIGSVLKNLQISEDLELNDEINSQEGQLIAVKVISVNPNYNKLELISGRITELTEGDIILGALGNRVASSGMTGSVPDELNKDDKIHILNLGGVIGNCKDFNILLGPATECEVVGSIVKERKQLNLKDLAKVKKSSLSKNISSIAVIGTGIDSGKTTVSSFIIKTLSKYFTKINACKLAGTASQKDLYSYEDNGANLTSDFVDYGLPSTCMNDKDTIQECSKSVIEYVSKDADVVLMELGDGYHGDYGTKEIIQNNDITKLIKVIIICAYDVSGAVNIIENLELNGLEDKLLIISGPVTNNVSAFNQSISKFKFKNLDFLNIYNSANHVNVFAKMINRISND